jgi:hypothetical protein
VTESKWLSCNDPMAMLDFLKGKASDRKLRLFAAGCYRSVWSFLPHEEDRTAVPVMEDHADGVTSNEQLLRAYAAIYVTWNPGEDDAKDHADAYLHDVFSDAMRAASYVRSLSLGTYVTLAFLLRCIFGNPFRPVTISPAALAWNDAVIVRLAQAAYEERLLPAGTLDNGRLAVLADALEEAGCTDADILGHLRGPGPHVRGCWAVDLILGKK